MVNVFAERPKNLPKTPRLPLTTSTVGAVPLEQLEDGTVRFAGTRVSLDSIIIAHKQGRKPVQINESFDLINVPDIEKAIAFYESEKAIVDDYLNAREAIAKIWQELNEERQRSSEWRAHVERLKAEQKQPV